MTFGLKVICNRNIYSLVLVHENFKFKFTYGNLTYPGGRPYPTVSRPLIIVKSRNIMSYMN